MKFTVLAEDRNCDNGCINENGLSIYIETDNNKFLLDSITLAIIESIIPTNTAKLIILK